MQGQKPAVTTRQERKDKMTRTEVIERLEEIKEMIAAELDTDEVTDYAREHAYIAIHSAIDHLKENWE